MKIQNPHLYAAVMLALSTLGTVAAVGIVITLTTWLGFAFVCILCIAFILFHVLRTVYWYWFERFKHQEIKELRARNAASIEERPAALAQKYAKGGFVDPTGDIYKAAAAEKIFGCVGGCQARIGERLFSKSPLLAAPYGQDFEFRVKGRKWHRCSARRARYLIARFGDYYEVRSYNRPGMDLKINIAADLPSLSAAKASLEKIAAASLSAQKKAPHEGNA